MFTKSKPTPKLDIKKQTPQTAQSWKTKLKSHKLSKVNKNLKKTKWKILKVDKKTKWKILKVDKNKTKEPQAHQKKKKKP
jgi:2C-methyl-D-erythritol 2,4-cyclodiphosphate synthase